MAIFALVAVAACAFTAGVGFGGGASDWADAETTWRTAIDRTTRKRAGLPTILFLKDIPPGARDSVMQKKCGNESPNGSSDEYFKFGVSEKKSWGLGEKRLQGFCGWDLQAMGLAEAMKRP